MTVEALDALAVQLQQRGLTRLYRNVSGPIGVLSVVCGATVWSDGKVFWWHIKGEETRLPAADPMYAARTLVQNIGDVPR